jgi:hypothetical protein
VNRDFVIVQRPGMVPERKGPWPGRMLEDGVRELYQQHPDAVVIVMRGLPDDCWPEHGKEFLAILDAERPAATTHNQSYV